MKKILFICGLFISANMFANVTVNSANNTYTVDSYGDDFGSKEEDWSSMKPTTQEIDGTGTRGRLTELPYNARCW